VMSAIDRQGAGRGREMVVVSSTPTHIYIYIRGSLVCVCEELFLFPLSLYIVKKGLKVTGLFILEKMT
jgi:hypothetical protein